MQVSPCALHSRKSVVCVSQGVITGMSNGTKTRYNDQNWFVKMALSALHLIKSTVSVSQEVSLSMSKGTQARLFKALIYRPIHWLSLSQKKSSYIPPCRRRSPSVWIASTKMASSALRRWSSPENRKHGPAGSNPVKKTHDEEYHRIQTSTCAWKECRLWKAGSQHGVILYRSMPVTYCEITHTAHYIHNKALANLS